MKNFTSFSQNAYFGAANGYTGFRHYFDEIFSPELFARIFILKGGPGTGKSSFMQSYAEYFKERADVDVILCSSDSDSLDGVIINYLGKKFAIIDGTAPHEIGLKIPGVRDEIINLGDNWDSSFLSSHAEEIIALNKEKKVFYKQAYESLRIAGVVSDIISCTLRENFDVKEAVKHARILISGEEGVEDPKRGFLLKAFNKNGIEIIPYRPKKSVLNIGGKEENSAIFMQIIYSELVRNGCNVTKYTSPLDGSVIDAIETRDIIFSVTTGDAEINSDVFEKNGAKSNPRYEELKLTEQKALVMAKDSFLSASAAHTSLEKIYKSAMIFEKNEHLLTKLIEQTEAIAKK